VKTQTHVSGETWLEGGMPPYRTTCAATIWGDDLRNAFLALARARSRDRLLAGGRTAGTAVGAGDEEALGDAVAEGGREVPPSAGEVAAGVGTIARGEPATWVPTRKDPAATASVTSAMDADSGLRLRTVSKPARLASSTRRLAGRLPRVSSRSAPDQVEPVSLAETSAGPWGFPRQVGDEDC
jgi:hypothetical protein